MTFSKSLFLTSLLVLTTLSTACFKTQNNKAEDWARQNAATFIVEELKGTGVANRVTNDWGLPDAQFYNFKVCTRDMHSNEPLKGHKFLVVDKDGNIIQDNLTSTADGCVNWSETIAFNPVADPKYIPMTRYLRANGIHRGQRKLSFAINPWSTFFASKTFENVVDLSRTKIAASQIADESQAQLYLMGEKKIGSKTRKLWVDGMIINISSQGATDVSSNATLKLDILPKLITADMLGNPELIPLNKGKFTVKAYIISLIKDGDKTYKTLLGTATHMEPQRMLGERVRFDIPISMPYRSSLGQLEIALVLNPVDAPVDIGSFEGTFVVGSFRIQQGFIGNTIKNDFYKFDKTFSVDNYMKTVSIPDPLHLPSGIFAVQPFEFDYIDIPFAQVKTEMETPTSRTIAISMQTIVRNPMENNDPVRNIEFTITLWDGTKIKQRTNQTGILAWRDKLSYKTYSAPHYVLKNIKIEHSSGFGQTIPVRINPWALFGYALGYDVRRYDAQSEMELSLAATNLIPSQMFMGKYILQINENIKYQFRKDLTVEPYKSVLVNLAPKILNYSHPINGIESSYPFRDGNYLLKMSVVTDLLDRRIVTTTKKIVKVREGQIREDVRLRFPDLRQMRVKSSLYFEILPIDYNKLTPFLVATKLRPELASFKACTQKEVESKQCNRDLKHFSGSPFDRIDAKALFIDEQQEKKITQLFPNLDDLVEKDAGIEIRTFVGTNYTPYSNKSEGDLRPTDDLDEKIKNNPEVLRELLASGMDTFNNPGEVTRFFSRMHACDTHHGQPCLLEKEVSVADLEVAEAKQTAEEVKFNEKVFTTENFVKHANAEYVVLTPSSESVIYNQRYPNLKTNNKIIPFANSADSFLKMTNSLTAFGGSNVYPDQKGSLFSGNFFPKVFEAKATDLDALLPDIESVPGRLTTDKSLSPVMATRMCNFFFNHLFSSYSRLPFGNSTNGFFKKCIDDTQEMPVDNIFVLDQKIRVFDFDQMRDLDTGYYSRISVSSDYRVGWGHGNSNSQSIGVNFSVGEFITSAIKMIRFIGSVVGVSYSNSWSESFDSSTGKSSNLGAGTNLSGEQGTFHLTFNLYERCAIVRINPKYIIENKLFENFLYNGADKVAALNRGVMFCKGILEDKKLDVAESVFYFMPDPVNGALIEETDPRNYPWAVNFRGYRDYNQLMNLLRIDGITSATNFTDLKNGLNRTNELDANKKPIVYIDRSINRFNSPRSTGGVVTTYPGIYTVP